MGQLTQDLDAFLVHMAEGLSSVLGAERTSIFIYDAETNEIWSKVAQKLESQTIRLTLDQGIAGRVASTKTKLNITDVAQNQLWSPDVDRVSGFQTRSVLCVPMLDSHSDLVGVIEVMNKRNGNFSVEDEALLGLFASFAAAMVRNTVLEDQVRQKDRLAATGSMAGSLVHDIRNIITLVRGYSELLHVAPEQKEIIGIIHDEMDRLVEMCEEVLDFAKNRPPAVLLVATDLNAVVEKSLQLVRRDYEMAGLELKFTPGASGLVDLDTSKLPRAIYNITRNARRALESKGTLTVSTHRVDDTVELRFEDDGTGIDPELLPNLFEPFVSGTPDGTGLGLPITKRIVEAHGGRIELESQLRQKDQPGGTRVTFIFPVLDES